MACTPNFDTTVNFECIRDLISEVRTKTITTASIQKALWVVGGILNVTSVVPIFGTPIGESGAWMDTDVSTDELVETIDAMLDHTPIVFTGSSGPQLDPALIFAIVKLIFQLLQGK